MSNSYLQNKKIYHISMSKNMLSCFKQFSSNFTSILELWIKAIFIVKLFFDVAWVMILSSDNPLSL